MKLSEVEKVNVGLNVISALGNPGTVTQVILEADNLSKNPHDRVRYDTLYIDWQNGKKSIVFHMNADAITVAQ